MRAGAGARHGQLRRVRPRLLRICRASHRARASESSQCALAEAIADTELLVAAGLCWLTRTARRRCRRSWIRARLGLRTCAHCCCRTIATIQTLCACSAESARRCAQRGWLVTGTPVRALTPLRFFPSVRRLSACGASRAVFGPGADAAAGADGGRAERARHVCQNAVQHLVRVSMRTTVLCAHSTFAIVGRSHAGRYAAR